MQSATAAVNPIAGLNTPEPQNFDTAPAINDTQMPNTIATPQALAEPKRALPTEDISPNATRWVFTPTRNMESLDALAFGVWSINANTFFPFRGLAYDLKNHKGDVYGTVRRTPAEQVADIRTLAAAEPKKNTVDLFDLAKLEDERAQIRILTVLSNPHICKKYPHQLKNLCTTCWHDYLATEAMEQVEREFAAEPNLLVVALKTLEVLYNALANDMQDAKLRIAEAQKLIDDEKSGKSGFYDQEIRDIQNTHADMPRFRTSTDKDSQVERLAEIMLAGMPGRSAQTAAGLSADDVQRMIDQNNQRTAELMAAKDEEIARLRALVTPEPAVSGVAAVCGDTGGVNAQGEPCKLPGKNDGRCQNHPR